MNLAISRFVPACPNELRGVCEVVFRVAAVTSTITDAYSGGLSSLPSNTTASEAPNGSLDSIAAFERLCRRTQTQTTANKRMMTTEATITTVINPARRDSTLPDDFADVVDEAGGNSEVDIVDDVGIDAGLDPELCNVDGDGENVLVSKEDPGESLEDLIIILSITNSFCDE